MKPTEWEKNNAPALQALICGLDPDDYIRKESTETCTMAQAAEICKVSIHVMRCYECEKFPEIYLKLGIPKLPRFDGYTKTFEKAAIEKWAVKLEEVRKKAEELAPKPRMSSKEAYKKGWVRMGDLAQIARIKVSTLSTWFRNGIPEKYELDEPLPVPTYKSENVRYYDKSALEWAKKFGAVYAQVTREEEAVLRCKAQEKPEEPSLIRRPVLAAMIGMKPTAFSMWCTQGIPKTLKDLGCPEVPETIYDNLRAANCRADEAAAWILEYRKAREKQKQKRAEGRKRQIEKQRERIKNRTPRSKTAWDPDTSDLGFEVLCALDAAKYLGISPVTLNKIINRGVSRRMSEKGVPDFPQMICERKRFKLYKKSEVEQWGKTYRSIFPA